MFPVRANLTSQRVHAAAPAASVILRPRIRPGRRLVGIFGGSFDPPTRSHLQRIRELATSFKQGVIGTDGRHTKVRLDELWVVPVFQHANPAKRAVMTAFPDRLRMLEIGLAEHLGPASRDKAALRISSIEAQLGGISRTNDMITALRSAHPNCDFVVYLGADIRRDLDTWHAFDALQRMACVQFLSRAGHDSADTVGSPIPEMSSTDYRNAVGRGDLAAANRLTEPRISAFLAGRPDIVTGYVRRAATD